MKKLNSIPGYFQVSDCYVINDEGKLVNSKTNRVIKTSDYCNSNYGKRVCLSTKSGTSSSFSAYQIKKTIDMYRSWGY